MKQKSHWWARHVAVTTAVLAMLCGCSTQPSTPAPHLTVRTRAADHDAYYREYLEALGHSFREMGLEEIPTDVRLVRYLDEDEFPKIYAECVREHGFAATPGPDGGVHYTDVPAERAMDQLEAMYRCEAQYPPVPPEGPAR